MGSVRLTASIVLYKNPREEILKIIAEINKLSVPFHLYVLDNSPESIFKEDISDDNMTLIKSSHNLGFGGGHNVCLRLAEKLDPVAHLFINPDVDFSAETVEKIFEFVRVNDNAGIVSPAVFYPDGSFQYICRTFPTVFELVVRFAAPVLPKSLIKKVNETHELHSLDYDSVQSVPMVNGCFFMARYGVLKKTGYFDERYFLYFEDVDLCRRVGMVSEVIYYPETKITHILNRESKRNLKLMLVHITSAIKYFLKWGLGRP